ncbi:MAG TPA: hypothetical protein P5089_02855 [Candidatus Portnoybacteria bacterium]|nr:hypothetical protein [Candidatus Portnoybacteria bacterium]
MPDYPMILWLAVVVIILFAIVYAVRRVRVICGFYQAQKALWNDLPLETIVLAKSGRKIVFMKEKLDDGRIAFVRDPWEAIEIKENKTLKLKAEEGGLS